jgi:hypothetical protein
MAEIVKISGIKWPDPEVSSIISARTTPGHIWPINRLTDSNIN